MKCPMCGTITVFRNVKIGESRYGVVVNAPAKAGEKKPECMTCGNKMP